MHRNAADSMEILLKTLTGKIITLNVTADMTIYQVKELIERKEAIPINRHMIFLGRPLKDTATVGECEFRGRLAHIVNTKSDLTSLYSQLKRLSRRNTQFYCLHENYF